MNRSASLPAARRGLPAQGLRFLIAGWGSAGRRHAGNLAALGAAEISVFSHWNGAKDFKVFDDFSRALAGKPDAVIVSNATSLHAATARQALRAGCHVYLEKPAGLDASEARDIADAARAAGQIVAVGCQLRFNPCLSELRKRLNEGQLGRLVSAQVNSGEYLPDYHPGEDYRQSYAARRALGGGVLLTQIHDINYLNWLFGPFASLHAAGGKLSALEIDVEDSVSLLLAAANGFAATAHMDFLQRARARTLEVIGERGRLSWDYYQNSLLWRDGGAEPVEIGPRAALDRNQLFLDALSDFLDCLREKRAPRTGIDDAVADLAVVDAARLSMQRGAGIPL